MVEDGCGAKRKGRGFGSVGLSTDKECALGYERLLIGTSRFSRDRPRFTDTLDMIKFLCKDMWTLVFRKQIDNLKTNHRVRRIPVLREAASHKRLMGG